MKRFSKEELFILRNKIEINKLIHEILKVPSKVSNGCIRFRCPACFNYNTSTKSDTNLARCFLCEMNLNTIEMVMAVKKTDFYPSAQFLQSYLPSNISYNHVNSIVEKETNSNPKFQASSYKQKPKKPSRIDFICNLVYTRLFEMKKK